jgi:hypothetical protein
VVERGTFGRGDVETEEREVCHGKSLCQILLNLRYNGGMQKAEVFLEDWEYQRLKSLSEETDRSLADLLRDAVKELLQSGALHDRPGTVRPPVIGNSLDHLFGTWSAEEEDEFLKAIEIFEGIDESPRA